MTTCKDFLDPGAPGGRYLPWKEVAFSTGLSRTTAWRLQRRDEFPPPYVISPGRVGYLESEVSAWKASRAHRTERAPARRTHKAPIPCEPPPPAPAAQVYVGPRPVLAFNQHKGVSVRALPQATRRPKGRADRRQMTFDF